MIFERIYKTDKEVLKCFIPIRKNFYFSSKSAIKQINKIINNSVTFYKVYDHDKLIGCLYINEVYDDKKEVEFSGFAYRHVNTEQAIREFIGFIKHYYPDYSIKAVTKFLSAKIVLTRVGFKNKDGDYIYG